MVMKKVKKKEKINPKEVLNRSRSYSDKIQDELELKGVMFFSPNEEEESHLNIDKDYLKLPLNITDVSARDLGEYLNAYTQQKMYMRTLLGYAECLLEEARRDYYNNSEGLYRELSTTTKLSETAKERTICTSEEVKPYYDTYMDCKKKVQLLNFNISSIEDAIFMISREVSRRNGDFAQEGRNYNVQNS